VVSSSTASGGEAVRLWLDCGLGKTPIALEWSRQIVHRTGGRVLIVTLNEIVPQWLDECRPSSTATTLPIIRLESRQQLKDWAAGRCDTDFKLAVTNYEKFNHKRNKGEQVITEIKHLAGVAADEGTRLNTPGGVQKWAIIKGTEGVEYKLICTATPAPNDWMEFCSQAGFLEKFRSEASVTRFLSKDKNGTKWTIKPHARKAFFEFLSSWSIYCRDPKRFGWRLHLPDVPAPEYRRVEIAPTDEQMSAAHALLAGNDGTGTGLYLSKTTNTIERSKLSQIAKGFVYAQCKGKRTAERIPSRKPAVVAGIVRTETAAGAQVIVWTVFDAESTIVAEQLRAKKVSFELLTGKTDEVDRLSILDRFRRGETRVLVSRTSLVGFGLNFQFCTAMVFSGWTDSYADLYQGVRRAVRHGQTERVRVYLPYVNGLEDETLANLDTKARRVDAAICEMEDHYLMAMKRKGVAAS
jgi:SNF2 family DNA or RNA helicase